MFNVPASARQARLRSVPWQPNLQKKQNQENPRSSFPFSFSPCSLIKSTKTVSRMLAQRELSKPFTFGYNGYNFEDRRWNCKAKADFLGAFLAEIHILTQLRVAVGHALVGVPKPEPNEVFRGTVLAEPRGTEAAESMKSCLLTPHS